MNDSFQAFRKLAVNGRNYGYYSLCALEEAGVLESGELARLPFSIRILLESVLRNVDNFAVTEGDVANLARWSRPNESVAEVPFKPARVILQDFTGVPAVVDLAAMRNAMQRLGGNPEKINPLIPVDLVIDHSVQTDYYGTSDALTKNVDLEFTRNGQRYSLLRWAQKSLDNFRVIPPATGIIHQVNLEYLGRVVVNDKASDENLAGLLYPDSVVGTDSHTVMINGLGVLGWGVGGIEAEAVMLGQAYYMLAPEVIGVELTGKVPEGVTTTDVVLVLTQMLRREGVVGKFVEFFGAGAAGMAVADRAVLANMAPEYGATMGYFPVDEQTLAFLRQTGRDADAVAIIEAYMKAQGLFRDEHSACPAYTKTLTLDLSTVEPSMAGPKRPQDRVPLSEMKTAFENSLVAPVKERGFALTPDQVKKSTEGEFPLRHGSVVIASITSCTNTSNPHLMIAAGLLAKKACELGMAVKPYVKTSLGPGSRVVTDYLSKANLLGPLQQLGFHVVGYGCLTCIGNSGPLPEEVAKDVIDQDIVVAAVLSGNRNFEGRVNPLVKANYLASPPLVVAYALAGTVDIDLTREPIGCDFNGHPVMLADLMPKAEDVEKAAKAALTPDMYVKRYCNIDTMNTKWNAIPVTPSELFRWDKKSTYIQEPPFLSSLTREVADVAPITAARALLMLGDSVTTDHISPAGAIKANSPAGEYLLDNGVALNDFNSYGSRRGNDRVMTRGTFANIRIRNLLAPGTEGGVTPFLGRDKNTGPVLPVFDAAMRYAKERISLVVLGGAEYGTGSSRDWAAKGTALLGVRAVIAKSFERIHRGNLVGMGVLPLEFLPGEDRQTLNLDGTELFTIEPVTNQFQPQGLLDVVAKKTARADKGAEVHFKVRARIDTPVELDYYLNGGILPTVLRKLLQDAPE
ncbi:MAG: aconitate hydratase AcnA [Planctomycetia bacterium]|nr:aconitate hydratase AcnA [Planctomycetia bacterium]